MYCVICGRCRFSLICKTCLENLWYVEIRRQLGNNLRVFSSYPLSEIKHFIYSKNNIIGSRILKILGKYALQRFLEDNAALANIDKRYTSVVCVRGRHVGLYSHSAILAHCFKKYGFSISYNALISQSDKKFSHLGRNARISADRDFTFKLDSRFDSVIIVDDIVTTSQTLLQASNAIINAGKIPLFAWTLCDARY